jgi:hypothetical protein
MAIYAYRAASPGQRGKAGTSEDLVKSSVFDVTGGVFDIGGQDFVSPAPGVTRNHMIRWMRGQSEDTLPPMVDGNGADIPTAEIADDLDRGTLGNGGRFMFVSSGTPGKYYIGDTFNMVGGQPMLLMSKEDMTIPAVKYFNPSEMVAIGSTRRRRQ